MYDIEAGERRTLVEEILVRTHNLVLKKEEEISGGVRCFYGFEDNKQGFFEVIYLDDIVLDFKLHDDIVKRIADESLAEHIQEIAEIGNEKEEVESYLDMLFFKPIGPELKLNLGKLQKYGVKQNGKTLIRVHVVYDDQDLVVNSKVVTEEVAD